MQRECRRVRKRILEYADGLSSEKEGKRIESHLNICRKCRDIHVKLETSGRALSRSRNTAPGLSEKAVRDFTLKIRSLKFETREGLQGLRLNWRVPAALGAALALVFAVTFLVVTMRSPVREEAVRETAAPSETGLGLEESTRAFKAPGAGQEGQMTVRAMPEARVTDADYDKNSLREMLENLDIRKRIAKAFTMGDSALYSTSYSKHLADRFSEKGGDGALLESMISYITLSEPILMPFYVEKAKFNGRDSLIIAFAGPPRTGKEVRLTRCEVWVMDPVKFVQNPDSGIILFHEQKF